MVYYIRNIIASLLLPPGLFFVLVAILVLLNFKKGISYSAQRNKKRYISLGLIFLLFSVYIFSTYFGELMLVKPLEDNYAPLDIKGLSEEKSAIVILGGGIKRGTLRGEEIEFKTLSRLYEGLKLYQNSGYELVVTGGTPPGMSGISEAEIMRDVLVDFGVDSEHIMVEDKALTTWLNAVNTTGILEGLGYRRIILVTDAIHMSRSLSSFQKNWKYELIAAPANYLWEDRINILDFFPNGNSLENNIKAMHEWLGLIWYLFKR
ncbi:uncharacterized SAM-binding protein YcdF (DUF218 family) [Orenia metallireducens]|jgi:uncharacterized SAM-binding protein YcdF (DUF218 family)|uniref:Uncharacterized SAM-binding protein YcdF, DUF218 family n=1 Tax=Orenia metallireducens TaxID=1413210 RepID=A0A285HPF2_9FIRM|nr:YdcF family protein [Orenia metallireducens]PRX27971.1 uncharacterized SAM-binding protein YcdF (DUF218 family) [Orenia metallireducens]SNY37544.1 Uncharacterized SAM-binding protein YcdF, DUF218 family [Orenia metallireducens]